VHFKPQGGASQFFATAVFARCFEGFRLKNFSRSTADVVASDLSVVAPSAPFCSDWTAPNARALFLSLAHV
jgi:hypothetical protein